MEPCIDQDWLKCLGRTYSNSNNRYHYPDLVMSLRLGKKKKKPGTNPERVLLRKCNYVPFITLNSCFINSQESDYCEDIWHMSFPPLQSPAQHTSQVSLCPTDVSSGLGRRVCECTGIQRGAKFRPLTWSENTRFSTRGTSGIPVDSSVSQLLTPWTFNNLALSMHTAANCLDHRTLLLVISAFFFFKAGNGHV